MSESKGLQRIGRYRLEAELGQGAMGIVYKARDERIDRLVALKTLRPLAGVDDSMAMEIKQRFLNEAKAAGRLSHPNIVTVFDADEDAASGLTYLAMELVDGVELKSMLKAGPLPTEETLSILSDVAAALDHAHARGIIHRDVKPANIMVDQDGRAQLADFGIARLPSSTMTQAGALLGSPAYMSPEQIRGRPVSSQSDVFALAVIAYECLTGRRPFGGDSMISTTQAIVSDIPPPPSSLNPSLDPLVDAVLAKGLAKVAEKRFVDAMSMMEVMHEALAGRPTTGLDHTTLDVAAHIIGHEAATRAAGTPLPEQEDQGEDAGSEGSGRKRKVAAALVLVLLTLALAAGYHGRDQGDSETPTTPVQTSTPKDAENQAPSVEETTAEGSEVEPVSPADAAAAEADIPMGTLTIDLSTFSSGVLTVTYEDTGDVILSRTVSSLKRRRGFSLKNPKRHFQLSARLPATKQRLRFTFKVRDGKTLWQRSVTDIPADGTLRVNVDVGTLGRDLDVEFP